ncbi:MAG: hypothetical protein ACKV2Q_34660 [Planctomycetaceae bacterium]
MTSIVLDEQQSQVVSEAKGPIELRDQRGNRLGFFTLEVRHGFTDEDIELAKQRRASNSRYYTTKEVIEHLQKLGEAK